MKKIENILILEALLSCKTIEKAAKKLNINRVTIFNRLKTDEFKKLIHDFSDKLLNEVLKDLNERQKYYIDAIDELANDPEATIKDKLQCYQTVLNYFLKIKGMQE